MVSRYTSVDAHEIHRRQDGAGCIRQVARDIASADKNATNFKLLLCQDFPSPRLTP